MLALHNEAVYAMADTISEQLAHAGLCSQTPSGERKWVRIKRILRSPDHRFVLFEVDMERLPDRVTVDRLHTASILAHLSAMLGVRVYAANSIGLTYIVDTTPDLGLTSVFPASVTLPEHVPSGFRFGVPFGVTAGGEMLWGELANLPNSTWTGSILIGATSGYGKTSAITALLVSLLRVHGPDQLRLALVDPKATDLAIFDRLPHLLCPLATDAEGALDVLDILKRELAQRKAKIAAAGLRNIWEYNEHADEPLPLVVAVWDEMYDIALGWGGTKSSPYKDLVTLLAQGRAFGVLSILATQYPRADIIDTTLRANCGTRMALYCSETVQYRSILDRDAPTLDAVPGRAALTGPWGPTKVIQGCLVSKDEIQAAVSRWVAGPRKLLTDLEARMVIVAVEKYDGRFTTRELWPEFRGEISSDEFKALAMRWHVATWLTQDPTDRSGKKPRRVTPGLLELARAAHKAELAV